MTKHPKQASHQPTRQARLTVERLFSDPPPFAEPPRTLRMAPDGKCLTFLKPAQDDRERLDLWRADAQTGEARCWVRGTELPGGGPATAAELAAMERHRQFAAGITGQQWFPDSSALLLTAGGAAWRLDAASGQAQRLTPEDGRYTDIKLSPKGAFISYVGDGNLYIRPLRDGAAGRGQERAIAASDDPHLSFGIADFLAGEELHRHDGHWWHKDERWLAFTKVDVAPVAPSRRIEAGSDGVTTVAEHYPFAGAANPRTALALYDVRRGATHWLEFHDDGQDYLARATFVAGALAVQTLNRAQNRLVVKTINLDDLTIHTLLEETSPTWINLHDNFTAIGADDYLWTSERSGASQLHRCRNGKRQQLTHGNGRINKILFADQTQVLVAGWRETPTEQHLYRIALANGESERLTARGWHELTADGEWVFDHCSSLEHPGEVRFGRCGVGMRKLRLALEHPYRAFRAAHVTPALGVLEAEDGQALHYRLTKPSGLLGPTPLIVHVYGGPGVQRVRNDWAPLLLQLFAQHGFGVLELDNRGSANRGRDFEAPIHRRLGHVEVRDQVRGAEFAAALPWVDSRRIGIFGHSYGGYMALMCAAQAPRLFRAAVSAAPVTDWRLYDSCYTERYLGMPEDNPEGYEMSAVFPHLDHLAGRLLLMHGMADDNVAFTHSMRLMQSLQAHGLPFELMTYPGAKHAMQQKSVATHRFNLILDFFRRHLCSTP